MNLCYVYILLLLLLSATSSLANTEYQTVSNPDPRDYSFSDLIRNTTTALPEILMTTKGLLPRTQGSQGSCSAHTASEMMEVLHSSREYFSPQYIYNLRSNKNAEGMSGRETMKILQEYGIPLERQFRYNIMKNREPNEELIEKAKIRKINEYYRVYTINEAKYALYLYGPLFLVLPKYDKFRIKFWISSPEEEPQSYHAMSIIGYDTEGFICKNHWGIVWNIREGGYVHFPYTDWNESMVETWLLTVNDTSISPEYVFWPQYHIMNLFTKIIDLILAPPYFIGVISVIATIIELIILAVLLVKLKRIPNKSTKQIRVKEDVELVKYRL